MMSTCKREIRLGLLKVYHPLSTVVSAEPSYAGWSTGIVFVNAPWVGERLLVEFGSAVRDCQAVLRGLGDFPTPRGMEP